MKPVDLGFLANAERKYVRGVAAALLPEGRGIFADAGVVSGFFLPACHSRDSSENDRLMILSACTGRDQQRSRPSLRLP